MALRQSASASAPLQASVTSIDGAAPNSPMASAACPRVNGSRTCASVQFRRRRPKKPRLSATAVSANLLASGRALAVAVGTGDLLQGNLLPAEGPSQVLDGFEALEPCRAGEDVDVHRARFRPCVKDSI